MSDVDFLYHPYHEPYQKRRKVICLFTFFTSSHDHDDNQDDDNNRSNFSFSLFFLGNKFKHIHKIILYHFTTHSANDGTVYKAVVVILGRKKQVFCCCVGERE